MMMPLLPSAARRWLIWALCAAFLGACASPTAPAAPTVAVTDAQPGAPTSVPTPTPPADARSALAAYFTAWQAGDYAAMYLGLDGASRAAFTAEAFEAQYRAELEKLTATAVSGEVLSTTEDGETAAGQVRVRYTTDFVGPLETEMTVPLRREAGQWRVTFAPALIWPELVNGQQLLMVPIIPDRGAIYDRNGRPLAVGQAPAYAVGLVPSLLGESPDGVVGVSRLLEIPVELLNRQLAVAVPDQYLALGEAPGDLVNARFGYLFDIPGVQLTPYTDRYYYGNGAAAPVTGYTTFIQADEVAAFRARGYIGSERVGRTGLEAWGEDYLRGQAGAQLQLRDANLTFLRMIAQTEQTPSQDLYTTLDADLQAAALAALGDFTGAVVVMDVNTGEVLAMASAPSYSPNIFSPFNRNAFTISDVLNDPRRPLLNHAAQSTYPAGSVFKIITMAAGLTSGLFAPDTLYNCTGEWNETGDPNFTRKDWLEGGHGEITLQEGLAGSCNPYFWHVGFALFNWDPDWLSETAGAFGLGQPTNIGQIEESPGQIPGPAWKQRVRGEAWTAIDQILLSIGQGEMLVTPLQIARLTAAMANGGTLYQPQLVREVRAPGAEAATLSFQPIISGTLPLTPDQLAAMQEAMRNVTREPIGTARVVFRGFRIPVAGKTGTAEDPGLSGERDPDAWFTAYTYANQPNRPDIAVSVVIANQGQGSDFAAPVARRVIEAYFGLSYKRYPWEESIGVRRLETPTPEPGAEPPATPTP